VRWWCQTAKKIMPSHTSNVTLALVCITAFALTYFVSMTFMQAQSSVRIKNKDATIKAFQITSCQRTGHVLDHSPRGTTYWVPSSAYKVHGVLAAHGWTRVKNESQARLVWTRSNPQAAACGSEQLVSLLDNLPCLTTKDGLARTLKSMPGIAPPTYAMNSVADCRAFFAATENDNRSTWVMKPALESSGMGIRFITPGASYADLKHSMGSCAQTPKPKTWNVVLQLAIQAPLLLNGHKMEIRSYWAVINTLPLMVVYHDGVVRLAAGKWAANNLEDRTAHVTNVAQAQLELGQAQYAAIAGDLKWSLTQFATHVADRGLVPNATYLSHTLRPTLKSIIQRVVMAGECVRRRAFSARAFELFGMDTILDSELRVWLTEMQHGPGLAVDAPVKRDVVLHMLDELIALVVEIDDRRAQGQTSFPTLRSMCGWSWIVNHS